MSDNEIEQFLEAGRIAWRSGDVMPKMPNCRVMSQKGLFWLGYMLERAQDFFRRRDMALYPDRTEFRP